MIHVETWKVSLLENPIDTMKSCNLWQVKEVLWARKGRDDIFSPMTYDDKEKNLK